VVGPEELREPNRTEPNRDVLRGEAGIANLLLHSGAAIEPPATEFGPGRRVRPAADRQPGRPRGGRGAGLV